MLNERETRWRDDGPLGAACDFEGKQPFKRLGLNLNVLGPGEPMSMYHRERNQEGFLVLAGRCLLIVEGEGRQLEACDFFHCPGGTTRRSRRLSHGARASRTRPLRPPQAYARFPPSRRSHYREGWLPDL